MAELPCESISPSRGKRVAFVDTGLPHWQVLADALPAGTELVALSTSTGQLAQMAHWAHGRHGYEAAHILCHATPGRLHLGADRVDAATLAAQPELFAALAGALAEDGDLLLYGCDLARGDGAGFVHALQALTGRNVAASSTRIGCAALGGDWELDYQAGQPRTQALQAAAFPAVLAPPVFVSATAYVGQNFVTLNYDQPLDPANPPPIDFFRAANAIPGGPGGEILVNGANEAVSSVTVSGNTVIVFRGSAFTPGDVLDLKYDDEVPLDEPNAIQNGDGEDAAAISFQLTIFGPPPGPAVTSIVNAAGSAVLPAGTGTLSYTVTFDAAVTGVDAADFTLALTNNAQGAITGVTGSGTTWTVTVGGVSGDGGIGLNLNASGTGIQDGASNPITAGFTGQVVAVDNTPPLAPANLALSASSDSGVQGDNVSQVPTPTITGTAEANATVTLYDTDGSTVLGTTTANNTGGWSITSSALIEGNHTLTAKQADAAGNVSPASANLAFRLDTIGPTGTALDRSTVPQSSAIIGATLASVLATDASGITWSLEVGNGVIDADNFRVGFSGNDLVALQPLAPGDYNIYVRGTDDAGNYALQTLSFTVANVPSVNAIVRAAAAPATVAASDTAVAYTVTFDQDVTGVDTSDFALTTSGSAAGTIDSVTSTGTGNTYTVTVNGITGDGSLRLDLNASGTGIQGIDGTAVTAGYTAGETFTLDHTAPAAPASIGLHPFDDTGVSNVDGITSVVTPRLSGAAEANATIRVYDSDGSTVIGTVQADGSGNWSLTSSTLSEGVHQLTARQVDAAGNVSAASPVKTVTIASTVAAPAAPALAVASDSGTTGDGRTSVTTPSITGTAAPLAAVTLYDTDGTTVLGTATANAGGTWSIASSLLSQGAHTLTVRQTDLAGNVSAPSAALSLTIDNVAPAAGIAPLLAAASDTDTQGDGITYVAQPAITGSAEANAVITLYDGEGNTVLGTATADGSGSWSINSAALALGGHVLSYTQTDAAGNVSARSAGLSLTIVAPPAPPATTIDGVQVTTQPVNLPGGGSGTALSIPIVTGGRVESSGSAGVADIPLSTAGGATLLLAQVPAGYGLETAGGASQPAGTSLERLIQAIIARTPDRAPGDQDSLTGNGQSFLDLLPQDRPLLVQTVLPLTGGTAPTAPLTLTGTSSGTQNTALVIDLENAAPGSSIDLRAVDFAAIIGAANINGGTSGQILAGDSADQNFTVGASLRSQLYAGGGSDTMQITASSAGPGSITTLAAPAATATLAHGGSGSDTAAFSGARADYQVEFFDAHALVTPLASPQDQAYVVNAESLRFADASVAVQNSAAMSTLAGLYADVLGRQADVAGIEFHAASERAGASLGSIALSIIASPEGLSQQQAFNGSAVHDLTVLYAALFDRAPDGAGLQFWLDSVQKGVTLEQVADGMMHSVEIAGRAVAPTDWNFFV